VEINQGCIEIVDMDQLKAVKREGKGYVVIKDTIRNTIHRPECDDVNTADFRLKVLDNKKRNGKYFWVDTVETARTLFKAKFCANCE